MVEAWVYATCMKRTEMELNICWQLGDFTDVEKAYLAEVEKIPETERKTQNFQNMLTDLGAFFLDLGLLDASKYIEIIKLLQLSMEYCASIILYYSRLS